MIARVFPRKTNASPTDALAFSREPTIEDIADCIAKDISGLAAAELHVGDRAWKKAMSILDKKYAEAKKLPFIRDPLAWALYHTWKEFDDGKRCD